MITIVNILPVIHSITYMIFWKTSHFRGTVVVVIVC